MEVKSIACFNVFLRVCRNVREVLGHLDEAQQAHRLISGNRVPLESAGKDGEMLLFTQGQLKKESPITIYYFTASHGDL